jgi:hypothetical protein
MFFPLSTLPEHIASGGPARLAEKIGKRGLPGLYRRD